MINARDYGITPGSQNLLPQLQDLVDENPGCGLYFPPGVYQFGVAPGDQWKLPSGTMLQGDGMGRTVFMSTKAVEGDNKTKSAAVATRGYRQTAEPVTNGITLRDLTFKGPRCGNQQGLIHEFHHGIAFSGAQDVRIERVEMLDWFGDGLSFGFEHIAGPNQDVVVTDSRFANCLRGGVTFTTGRRLRISGCDFSGHGPGVHIENGKSDFANRLNGVTIDGNEFHDHNDEAMGPAWFAAGDELELKNVAFTNNVISNCSTSRAKAFINPMGQGLVVSGNRIRDCHYGASGAASFVRLSGSGVLCQGNQIENCLIDSNLLFGFTATILEEPTGFVVRGNSIRHCIGPTTTNTSSAVMNIQDREGVGFTISDNDIYVGGFYYFALLDFFETLITENRVMATYLRDGDQWAGVRGLWLRHGRAIQRNNHLNGWNVPIYDKPFE